MIVMVASEPQVCEINRGEPVMGSHGRWAVRMSPTAEISRIGHNLKGSGLSYGFAEISRIGADMELAARNQDQAMLQQCCTELDEYVRRVRVRPI